MPVPIAMEVFGELPNCECCGGKPHVVDEQFHFDTELREVRWWFR
jgi:hypothetical protein